MLDKIKTTSGEYWLIDCKDTFQNILIGDAVRLTRNKNEDYYFIHDVQLIYKERIDHFEDVPDNEVLFFEYIKQMKEIPVKNFITEDFNVKKYLIE